MKTVFLHNNENFGDLNRFPEPPRAQLIVLICLSFLFKLPIMINDDEKRNIN